jgi:hypothetical protein
MKQTTNYILMIRPVAFRMNEQTAVNNYYQKVLDELCRQLLMRKHNKIDTFVEKLRAVGVTVVDDTLNQIRQIASFLIIGFHSMKTLMWLYTLCLPRTVGRAPRGNLGYVRRKGFKVENIVDYN